MFFLLQEKKLSFDRSAFFIFILVFFVFLVLGLVIDGDINFDKSENNFLKLKTTIESFQSGEGPQNLEEWKMYLHDSMYNTFRYFGSINNRLLHGYISDQTAIELWTKNLLKYTAGKLDSNGAKEIATDWVLEVKQYTIPTFAWFYKDKLDLIDFFHHPFNPIRKVFSLFRWGFAGYRFYPVSEFITPQSSKIQSIEELIDFDAIVHILFDNIIIAPILISFWLVSTVVAYNKPSFIDRNITRKPGDRTIAILTMGWGPIAILHFHHLYKAQKLIIFQGSVNYLTLFLTVLTLIFCKIFVVYGAIAIPLISSRYFIFWMGLRGPVYRPLVRLATWFYDPWVRAFPYCMMGVVDFGPLLGMYFSKKINLVFRSIIWAPFFPGSANFNELTNSLTLNYGLLSKFYGLYYRLVPRYLSRTDVTQPLQQRNVFLPFDGIKPHLGFYFPPEGNWLTREGVLPQSDLLYQAGGMASGSERAMRFSHGVWTSMSTNSRSSDIVGTLNDRNQDLKLIVLDQRFDFLRADLTYIKKLSHLSEEVYELLKTPEFVVKYLSKYLVLPGS
jgi:hypothetical protein